MINFNLGDTWIKVIFWTIIIVFFVYIYYIIDPRHNLCWTTVPEYCPDKFNVQWQEGDTNADLLRRLEGYTELESEKVFWRRSMLCAILLSFVLLFAFYRKLPPIAPFLTITLVFFVMFYFYHTYYSMHFIMRSDNFAKQTINEIRYRLGIAERPNNGWGNFW